MKKYFYIENDKQFGPYTIEELKGLNISQTTPIWHEELTDWTTAEELSEFDAFFGDVQIANDEPIQAVEKPVEESLVVQPETVSPQKQTSPPQSQPVQRKYPPKTWLVESILVTLFCCLPFGIVGIVFASKVESLFYAGDVAGAERASREAGKWTKIGFWIAAGIAILYFLVFLVQLLFLGGTFISLMNDFK